MTGGANEQARTMGGSHAESAETEMGTERLLSARLIDAT